ncbi:SMI1/KNR4 family protein [Lignipirellula cremea]|uniref:SMI1 / KNR4 family protein n=1 Tax=Lignipirellula cremea TaxID=2528010 RepID=A0A518DZZ8_9BACT|nr:SMI1/KNR4 family protein [Lignipirellula cremea]QDU97404.1 SMI1 / KNR4 family protein [Lignipirellula cremea]
MKLREIEKIERKLDVELPDAYFALLLGYPEHLAALMTIEVNDWAKRIYNDANEIIEQTECFRRTDFSEAEFKKWSPDYVVIGGDVGGNFYFINTKSRAKNVAVSFWFHEDGSVEKSASSIDAFIQQTFANAAHYALDSMRINAIRYGMAPTATGLKRKR